MGELKTYLDLLQAVKSDESLMAMISEYESAAEQLNELLQNPDYDAAEAIRLTNDAEYLSMMIQNNPLYSAYARAKDTVQKSMQERFPHGCGCSCAACQSKCSNRREYEEEK